MDHARVLNPNLIFHGLVDIWTVAGGFNGTALLSAKESATKILIGDSIDGSVEQQSALLSDDTTFTIIGTITPGATLRWIGRAVPVGPGATLADGPFHDVVVEFDIQSGNTLTTAALGWKTAFNAARAGTAITNGRVYCETLAKPQRADIAAGLALQYNAATSAGAVVTLVGVLTTYVFTTEVLPKPPQVCSLSTDTYPAINGIEFFGACLDPVLVAQGNDNAVNCGQSRFPIDNYASEFTAQVTLNALQNLDERQLRRVNGYSALASTNNYSVLVPNLFGQYTPAGMIMLSESQQFPGNKDIAIIRAFRSANATLSRKKVHEPLSATFQLVATDAADLLSIHRYRPSFSA